MTAQGEDILAYLERAIAKAETTARNACHESAGQWNANGDGASCSVQDDNGDVVVYDEGWPSPTQADHIALNDPASVLRHCAADQKLIESLTAVINGDYIDDGEPVLAERVLDLFAEGYGWTEGER